MIEVAKRLRQVFSLFVIAYDDNFIDSCIVQFNILNFEWTLLIMINYVNVKFN